MWMVYITIKSAPLISTNYSEKYNIYLTDSLYLPIKDVVQAGNLTRVLFDNYLNTKMQ